MNKIQTGCVTCYKKDIQLLQGFGEGQAAMIAGIANAESGRGRRRRNKAMYQNLLRGIPVNFTMLPRINRSTPLDCITTSAPRLE
jgi:hypothetical protein